MVAFLLRDGSIKAPETVAVYCAIAFAASVLAVQWFQTSSPIYRYFSVKDALDLLKACTLIAALSAMLAFLLTRLDEAPRSIPVLHFVLLATGLLAPRLLSRLRETRRETRVRNASNSVQRVLVIEASRLAWLFSKMLDELAPADYQIVAILDERPQFQQRSLNGYPIVGSPANIEKIVDEYATHGIRIDRVIVANRPQRLSNDAWDKVSRVCRERRIPLETLPERLIPGLSLPKADVCAERSGVDGFAAIAPRDLQTALARPFWQIKRVIDFAVAMSIAIFTLPVTLAVLCIAFIDVGSPVIFWQQRVGRNSSALHLYKFRTLQALFDCRPLERRQAESPSALGKFLQKTRLDELPQLWNILSGDMSLIGPRPLLAVDQPDGPSIRLAVRPGLSGWAQICGGKLISPEEKNALDEWYIRHASLWLDLVIVLRTLGTLLVGDCRDERAIAIAVGERLRWDFLTSSYGVAAGERRTAIDHRAGMARTPETFPADLIASTATARPDCAAAQIGVVGMRVPTEDLSGQTVFGQ